MDKYSASNRFSNFLTLHPVIFLILLLTSFVVALASSLFAYNYAKHNAELQQQLSTLQGQNTNITGKQNIQTETTFDSNDLQSFTDPHIEGMSFNYDPTVWEVISLSGEDSGITNETEWGGTGVYLKEKAGNGKLIFKYNLAFGSGGGYTPFRQSDIIQLTSRLTRVFAYERYQYGLHNNLVLFDASPVMYNQAKEICQQETNSNYEGMRVFTDEECASILSGDIIGYAAQPSFARSIRLKQLSSIKEIDPRWEGDQYVESERLVDGFIIIEISYQGNNPENADSIVKQIVQ